MNKEKPWLTAVDITKPGASKKIKELGRRARELERKKKKKKKPLTVWDNVRQREVVIKIK